MRRLSQGCSRVRLFHFYYIVVYIVIRWIFVTMYSHRLLVTRYIVHGGIHTVGIYIGYIKQNFIPFLIFIFLALFFFFCWVALHKHAHKHRATNGALQYSPFLCCLPSLALCLPLLCHLGANLHSPSQFSIRTHSWKWL